MSRVRRVLSFLTLLIFMFTAVPPARAVSGYEDVVAKAMRGALAKSGMQARMAANVAQQNVFFGIVMMKDVQQQLLDDQREKLIAQAERIGAALGTALGSAYKAYGGKRMQETSAVMMHAVRAGVVPEAASETFAALAQNGYAFDSLKQVIHEASEVVRSEKFADAGVELCRGIRKIAAGKGSAQELRREIVLAAKAESARQRALLAKNEAERRKRDGGSGGEGGSNRTEGRQAARGVSPGSSAMGSSARTTAGGASATRGSANANGSANASPGAESEAAASGGKSNASAGGGADANSGSTSGTDSAGSASGGKSGSGGSQSGSESGSSGAADGKSGSASSPGSGGSSGANGNEGGSGGSKGTAEGSNGSASGAEGSAADGAAE